MYQLINWLSSILRLPSFGCHFWGFWGFSPHCCSKLCDNLQVCLIYNLKHFFCYNIWCYFHLNWSLTSFFQPIFEWASLGFSLWYCNSINNHSQSSSACRVWCIVHWKISITAISHLCSGDHKQGCINHCIPGQVLMSNLIPWWNTCPRLISISF